MLVLDYHRFGLILILLLVRLVQVLLVRRRRNQVILSTGSKDIVAHIIEKVQGFSVNPCGRNTT